MRYRAMTIIGLALFAASVVGFCVALGDLLEVGTCASGNQPYVIARECPDGTAGSALLLGGSIVALTTSFLFIALRGGPPGGRRFGPSLMIFIWAAFFIITGAYALIFSLGSETIPSGGKLGGTIVGITFLVMGLPALIVWAFTLYFSRRDRER